MRYISEFKIDPSVQPREDFDRRLEYTQKRTSCGLGNLIGSNIGFDKQESYDPNDKHSRYALEVEVFSRKDWVEFKKEIGQHIRNSFGEGRSDYELVQFKSMFDRLENIGIEKTTLPTSQPG